MLSAVAMMTKHIGLIATASTTYNEPYHIARKFASLDHISRGRAGWNIVTSWSEAEAKNFNREQHLDYDTRYDRAAEFVEVVKGLWDSWDDDAFVHDKASGQFFDPDKMHVLDHTGQHFQVRGPLTVARCPQGRPVLVQAGASDQGQEIAAASADIVFTAQVEMAPRKCLLRLGQGPPAPLRPRSGGCAAAAWPAADRRPDGSRGVREVRAVAGPDPPTGRAGACLRPDGRPVGLPARWAGARTDRSGNAKPGRRAAGACAGEQHDDPATVSGGLVAGAGTAPSSARRQQIADRMQEWVEARAADGFNIVPSHLPVALDDFVELVVPELQRRGLFRTAYEGSDVARKSRPEAAHQPISRGLNMRLHPAVSSGLLTPRAHGGDSAADRAGFGRFLLRSDGAGGDTDLHPGDGRLRHAVRARRKSERASADGRRQRHLGRSADLHADVAAGPAVPRWRAWSPPATWRPR